MRWELHDFLQRWEKPYHRIGWLGEKVNSEVKPVQFLTKSGFEKIILTSLSFLIPDQRNLSEEWAATRNGITFFQKNWLWRWKESYMTFSKDESTGTRAGTMSWWESEFESKSYSIPNRKWLWKRVFDSTVRSDLKKKDQEVFSEEWAETWKEITFSEELTLSERRLLTFSTVGRKSELLASDGLVRKWIWNQIRLSSSRKVSLKGDCLASSFLSKNGLKWWDCFREVIETSKRDSFFRRNTLWTMRHSSKNIFSKRMDSWESEFEIDY